MPEEMTQTKKSEESDETTPLDDLISRVTKYRDDPKLVTRETMQDLMDELVDLKGFIDKDDEHGSSHESPGLSVIIGGMGKETR